MSLGMEAIDTPAFDLFCACVFPALLHASAGSVIDNAIQPRRSRRNKMEADLLRLHNLNHGRLCLILYAQ